MPEKEMLAVARGLRECTWLVDHSPHPIKVYTDHKGTVLSMANASKTHRICQTHRIYNTHHKTKNSS